ncbi:2-hydroxyacid dehydrogenase [Algihabitans albus]|uniref:2-hydroxyacid dehydrogenase n=1 Tax=Algihabitans albus TaxID=2164067 RepID=UPI000E5CE5A3|nr:D-glycerate dehydrogenase [Algihabitans albus]
MAKKLRALATRALPAAVGERLARDYEAHLSPEDRLLSPDEIATAAEGCFAIICTTADRFDRALIDRLPASVKLLATFSVGHEHIDLAAAKARGLQVSNTPDVLTDATADITLLCLLGAARRAWEAETLLREGRWVGWTTTQLCGTQVSGKRLGILGMGRIGRAVAARARGFGMTIHYANRRRLAAEQEQGATYHDRPEDMLPHCDFLSLNAPSTPDTHHFLNGERIALLPDGAIVVNTARGTLVEDNALIAALTSGKIAAAGLDVFEGEPQIDPRYAPLPNTFLLPHIGSATVETRNAMGFICLDNLDAVASGRPGPSILT